MKGKSFHLYQVANEHEVRNIEHALSQIEGVRFIHGDHRTKMFAIQWTEPATWTVVERTLSHMRYTVEHL